MKPVVYVDANVFFRFFTTDEMGHHPKAAALFAKGASGEIALVTGPPVLFEIAWTLRSAYRQTVGNVLDVLSVVVALPALRLLDALIAKEAIVLARKSGQEFADAYIAVSARGTRIATFNRKHFDRADATALGNCDLGASQFFCTRLRRDLSEEPYLTGVALT